MNARATMLSVAVGRPLQIPQGCGLGELVRQLQPHSDRIMCLVNEVELRHYAGPEPGLRPLATPERRGEYVFADERGNTYRVFGKSAAQKLCPRAAEPAAEQAPSNVMWSVVVDDEEVFEFEYVPPRVRLVPLGPEN